LEKEPSEKSFIRMVRISLASSFDFLNSLQPQSWAEIRFNTEIQVLVSSLKRSTTCQYLTRVILRFLNQSLALDRFMQINLCQPSNDLLEKDMSEHTGTTNWPELAIGLYDRLTGRQAEISYEFQNFSVDIPSSTSADAEHAHWKMNGTLRISTQDHAHSS